MQNTRGIYPITRRVRRLRVAFLFFRFRKEPPCFGGSPSFLTLFGERDNGLLSGVLLFFFFVPVLTGPYDITVVAFFKLLEAFFIPSVLLFAMEL